MTKEGPVLENSLKLPDLKFDEKGLIPAITQDINTREVIMAAYMNKEALEKTVSTGKAHYYSRSRRSLWLKGETSGNFQNVKSILYDCDADTLLLLVEPDGPACHTGEKTCFYRSLGAGAIKRPAGAGLLKELFTIIKERKNASPGKSYVASLYAKGLPGILDKIEEESGELIEAAKEKDTGELLHEFSDLLFHMMVLLAHNGLELEDVLNELGGRFGVSGIEEKESRAKKK